MPKLPRTLAALLASALLVPAALAQTDGWTGNMAKNGGFEEDWINSRGEGHVLSTPLAAPAAG